MKNNRISRHGQFHTNDIPGMLSNLLAKTNWTTLLDAGCGDGSLLHALNDGDYLLDKLVYALDVSTSGLEIIQSINQDVGCINGSAQEIPIADNSVDMFVSTQVIEHVPDDELMVKEIHRILADDGFAYVSTIFKKSYGWYFYRNNGKWVIDPTHVREYSRDEELIDILRKYNFEVLESCKTLETRPLVDAMLRRIGGGRQIYTNPIINNLRVIKLPIFGYYNWEILFKKKPLG